MTGPNVGTTNVGTTAFVVAYWRMRETERPQPLYSDHLAHLFLDAGTEELGRTITGLSPSTELLVNFRTRYLDDTLAEQLRAGTRQIVLLGAGLDTRAFRMATSDSRFFELDQPDVIAFKRDRLAAAGYDPTSVMVPCDYVRDDWLGRLRQAGLDTVAATYIIWEGNSMYIPRPEIARLLATMSALNDFVLSFDYLSQRLVENRAAVRQSQRLVRGFADLQAPWVTGFDRIGPFLANVGLRAVDDHLLADLGRRYRPERPLDARLLGDYRICTVRPASGNACPAMP